MRAPLISLLIAAAGLAAGGCASSPPQEDPHVASTAPACSATDPLHLTSNRTAAERGDVEIAAILMQRAGPRLTWVNRQMYQSLHALDVELRREQQIAACERAQSGVQMLQAQSSGVANGSSAAAAGGVGNGSAAGANGNGGAISLASAGGGGSVGSQAGATGGVPASGAGAPALPAVDVTNTGAAATPSASASGATVSAMSPAATRSTLVRKSSLSSSGGGGNGATMPKVVTGSDNDIVARRLRKAAEQETSPALRAKLWKEYADYRQGIAAK
jgi:hypothetical protein